VGATDGVEEADVKLDTRHKIALAVLLGAITLLFYLIGEPV